MTDVAVSTHSKPMRTIMSEEATEELENTTPEVEADASSEIEASPTDVKLETDKSDEQKLEDGEIDKNQYYALKRLANKNRKQARQLAKENADLEAKLAEASKPKAPKTEDYENYDDYIQAAVDYGVAQKTPTQPQYDHAASVRDDLMEAGISKYPDFSEVAFATKEMLEVMDNMDAPEDIAYFLGKNPDQQKRILESTNNGNDRFGLAREFGKLEAALAQPKPRTTNAPPPAKPLEDAETQPPDVAKMSMEEYAAFRNKTRWAQGKP